MNTELDKKIEGLLFMHGEPMEVRELAKLCKVSEADVVSSVATINERLATSATCVVSTGDTLALTTRPELAEFLQEILKLERTEPLTKAQLEVLSIVLYEHQVSAAKIEYIRGVNSRYSIRALMMRGLIERKANENDARSSVYTPTIDLLRYLGVTDASKLPDYESIKNKLAEIVAGENQK